MAELKRLAAYHLLLVSCVKLIVVAGLLSSPLSSTSLTTQLSGLHNGLQVILPAQNFKHAGIIYRISVQVQGPSSPMDIQIWRPSSNGTYNLYWFITFMENPVTVSRDGNWIIFYDPIGVAVEEGDVLGFYVYSNINPIAVMYHESSGLNSISNSLYYMEGHSLCTFSLCNASAKAIDNATPSIVSQLIKLKDLRETNISAAKSKHSLLHVSNTCVANAPILCRNQKDRPQRDDPDNGGSTGNTSSTRNITNGDSIAYTSPQSSILVPNPTPTQPTFGTRINPSELEHTANPTLQSSQTIFPGTNMDTDRLEDEPSATTSEQLSISPAAIAFIAVGVVFFIILVILLLVLCACICSKNTMRKTYIPSTQESCINSNLVVSSSVEHSNSSGNSGSPNHHTSASKNPKTLGDHTYANANVTLNGNFHCFIPHYVNGKDDESIRELLSERGSHRSYRSREGRGLSVGSREMRSCSVVSREGRGCSVISREGRGYSVGSREVRGCSVVSREGRGCSVVSREGRGYSAGRREEKDFSIGPFYGEKTYNHNDQYSQRKGRARSVSASTRYKVTIPRPKSYSNNLSILMKPLPLPPMSVPPPLQKTQIQRSAPQLNRHVPPPNHSPPPPLESSESTKSADQIFIEASGDYTAPVPIHERYKYDPKIRQNDIAEVSSLHQGRLFHIDQSHDYSDPDEPSQDDSIGYDHLSPLDVHPEHSHQNTPDLKGLKDEQIPTASCIRRYVPTKEQRRMMQLQYGGHYEIADEMETSVVNGYNHLTFFKETETYWAPAATAEDLYTQLSENKYREIYRTEVNILNSIGAGHFGKVRKGVWFNGITPVDVAIKTVKSSAEQERVKLLQEAAIMGQFAHSNVVRLHGVVTVGDPVLVILEYMEKGDLRSYLQKLHPKISKREIPEVAPRLFVKFSKDISNGMSYLAKKCFIHRDLAARNILVNDELTCKIGDFGMARDIENEGDYYKSHGGIIPVKWTAPEALHYNKYSSASDVWSYGMVLFEIWSLGEKPFSELSNPIVIALVSSKHCQPPPPGCPRPIYHLMVECWNPDHNQRPTFDSIYNYLDSPQGSLLQWHKRDLIQDKMAHHLGAPLEEANNLYLELQRTYQKPLI